LTEPLSVRLYRYTLTFVLVLLLAVLFQISIPSFAPPTIQGHTVPLSDPPLRTDLATSLTVSTQAISAFSLHTTATQTGAGQYQVSAGTVTIPFSPSSSANVSGYSLYLSGQGTSSVEPQGNGTQGGTSVLFNSTFTGQIVLFPLPSAITIKTISLWTRAGATVPEGTYGVWYNGTGTAYETFGASPVWIFNGTAYSLTYRLSPPVGTNFNQTQVFVPFPANVSVNYTSLAEKINGKNVSPIQATVSGVYIYPNGVAGGTSLNISIEFTPAPSTGGVVPVVVFGSYQSLVNGTNSAKSYYYNGRAVAYEGQYVLQTRFPATISPQNLAIRFGTYLVPNTSYTIAGGTITVLPFAYSTPANTNVTIYLLFVFAGNVPSLSIGRSSTVFSIGSYPVSALLFGSATLVALVLADFGLYTWGVFERPKKTRSERNPNGLGITPDIKSVIIAVSALAFLNMVILILLVVETT
jgi:hypothetical protein